LPVLKRNFIDNGKVALFFMHFPLEQIHGSAIRASLVASCAGDQGKFWALHDVLFRDRAWVRNEVLPADARALGIDESALAKCTSGRTSRIVSDRAIGRELGVTATPTFFLGNIDGGGVMHVLRRMRGALPYETFMQAIEGLAGGHQ